MVKEETIVQRKTGVVECQRFILVTCGANNSLCKGMAIVLRVFDCGLLAEQTQMRLVTYLLFHRLIVPTGLHANPRRWT